MFSEKKITNNIVNSLQVAISRNSLLSIISKYNISLGSFKNKNEFISFMNTFFKKQNEIYIREAELNEMLSIHKKLQKKNQSIHKQAKKLGIKLNIPTKTYTVSALIYRRVNSKKETKGHKYIIDIKGDYYVNSFGIKHFNVVNNDIFDFNGKRTYDYDKVDFKKLVETLSYDEEFNDLYNAYNTYFNCIIIKSVSNGFIQKQTIKDALFESVKLHFDDKEGGIYHKFIDYNINHEAKTFGELFNLKIDDYTRDNYKSNSCYINTLVDTFHSAFSKNKHYSFNATYDDFIDLFDFDKKKLTDNNIGLTINESIKFFEKFNLGLCVLGVFGVIKVFMPEKINTNIKPNKLYIVVSNGHCYQVNDKVNEFVQKIKYVWKPNEQMDEDLSSYKPSNRYIIRKKEDDIIHDVNFIKNIDCVYKDIKNTNDEDKCIKKYIYDDDLLDLLKDMMYDKKGYIPDVVFSDGCIKSLKFKICGILGTIEKSTNNENDKDVVLNPNTYKIYHEQFNKFNSQLLCDEYMSYYNPINREIEKQYKMMPMTGYFDDDDICNDKYNGLDSRKAYTSDLYDLEYYPIYGYFDIWKVYNDEKIEDYNQYIVRCDENTILSKILFPFTYSRCTGYKLNRIKNIDYQILYFKKPSKLVKSNSKEIIDEVYQYKFSDDEKENSKCRKDIVNLNIGLLGKCKNKKTVCKVFKNIDEASYYACKYGGNIKDLSYSDEENEVFINKRNVYLLDKKFETELINGFLPIHEMIYDIRSLKNYQTCVKLLKNKIKVYGVKTDCILFNKKDNDKVKELFDLSDKLGCFKIEENKELTGDIIKRINNNSPDRKMFELKFIEHKIENERDSNELNEVFRKFNTVVLGELPGVGKTYACKNSDYKNKLFVCPTNKLCQMLRKDGHEALTVHMLLGLGFNDQENTKMRETDISKYDCIVFDEIYLNSPNILMKIAFFMNNNKDKRFLATGDTCQLEPVKFDVLNNIENGEIYRDDCVKILFPHMIRLKECKRLKNKKDIEKMTQMKTDILNSNIPVMDTLRKYGFKIIDDLKDLKTIHNVAYYHYRCNDVNKYVIDNLVKVDKSLIIDKKKYWKGMKLICAKRIKITGVKCHVNYEYELKKINKNKFTLFEPIEDIIFELDIKFIDNFRYPYCSTVHSVQGLTYIENYTIFNCDSPIASRNWVYTAITRTDDISKITIFKETEKKITQQGRNIIAHYFNDRIGDLKKQDEKAKREFNKKDYVNVEWINDKFSESNYCSLCRIPFETSLIKGTVKSNISIDRMNNKKPHTKDNCRLVCRLCNVQGSNKRKD